MEQELRDSQFFQYKNITFKDLDKFKKFYMARDYKRFNPRFYTSIFYLSQFSKFCYNVFDNTLFVMKKGKIMNNKFAYLILPPYSINGDIKKEEHYVKLLAKHGIKTKLDVHDMANYNLKDGILDKGNAEFNYNATWLSDKKWSSRFTSYYNKYEKMLNAGEIKLNVYDYQTIPNKVREDIFKVILHWKENRLNLQSVEHYIKNINNLANANIFTVHHTESGKLLGFMICEDYNKHVILTYGIRNFMMAEKDYDHIMVLIMKSIGDYYVKKHGNCYLNFGAAVNVKGLYDYKNRYKPILINQLYNNVVSDDKKSFNEFYDKIVVNSGAMQCKKINSFQSLKSLTK